MKIVSKVNLLRDASLTMNTMRPLMYQVHGLQNRLAQHFYSKQLLNFSLVGFVLTTSISQGPTPFFICSWFQGH